MAVIFDVKPYSINDGPGIRVTIFLKGCPLSCAWCHNPEGISPQVQKLYSKAKCIGCGTCVESCPNDALRLTPDGIVTNTELCNLCGICAEVCPTTGWTRCGGASTRCSSPPGWPPPLPASDWCPWPPRLWS